MPLHLWTDLSLTLPNQRHHSKNLRTYASCTLQTCIFISSYIHLPLYILVSKRLGTCASGHLCPSPCQCLSVSVHLHAAHTALLTSVARKTSSHGSSPSSSSSSSSSSSFHQTSRSAPVDGPLHLRAEPWCKSWRSTADPKRHDRDDPTQTNGVKCGKCANEL